MTASMPAPPPPFDRDAWPIAAAMIPFPGILPDGRSTQDGTPEDWAAALSEVADAGFTEVDPTDGWLRIADLAPARLDAFMGVLRDLGLTIPAISTARKNLIDRDHGAEMVAYAHRVIDAAATVGAREVSLGLFGALTAAQAKALWFWTVDGERNPDDPESFALAVKRVRELGRHAEEAGIGIALEMYEDTYLGTADGAVRFVTEVGLPNVGINADLGNIVRLHRPVERWLAMVEKLAPFLRYWHVKNYLRSEDETTGLVVTAPTSLQLGIIDYRKAVRIALAHGFASPFLCEHYGGDGLGVSAANRDYLRTLLPRRARAVP